MRRGIFATGVAVALVWIGGWSFGQAVLPSPATVPRSPATAPNGLITHHMPGGPTVDYLVVLDPHARTLAVYRVEKERGEIALASVRHIDSDLKLLSYNTQRPLPEEIEAGLIRQGY